MDSTTDFKSMVYSKFFNPISEVLQDTKQNRNCKILNDTLWLESGVFRCIELFQSGRDFLQNLAEKYDTPIRVSTFFESLKSPRRLSLLQEVNSRICSKMKHLMPDPFQSYSCLDDFELFAGDGHFVAAACHDLAVPRKKSTTVASEDEKTSEHLAVTKYATGHIYTLNLRTHAMSHLDVADQINRKKEHEMRSLKRQTIETLRQGVVKGRKVLYVWDRAGIDFQQWNSWKNQGGIYFLSREKKNMKLKTIGNYPFDSNLPENAGILADELMATSMGVSIRRVTYQDPETDIIYQYLTNLPLSVPPGMVALLYKSRWDIEKVFDEFKNKLGETKSWASSKTAKTNQAQLLCLTHNLMCLMEEYIIRHTGVKNEAELHRKNKSRKFRIQQQKEKSGASVIPYIYHAAARLTQRTVKFVRWLKNHLHSKHDWDTAIAHLSRIYQFS